MTLPDLTAHPLLTPKARQMAMESPTKFAEEVALAADLLHVTAAFYEDAEDTDSLDRALVLQVGFRLARGESAMYAQAESGQREGESKSYREQRELLVSPEAARIVAAIRGDTYPTDPAAAYGEGVVSLRGRRPVPPGDGVRPVVLDR